MEFKTALVVSQAAAFAVAMMAPLQAPAQQRLFKCGATYQDRPCPAEDLQKRYSHTAGEFSISQVNPDTDKDCANAATQAFPLWQRMNAGEPLEKLKAEVDAQPISRYEKSRLRDALIAIRQYSGPPREVRSQLESQCMNYKRSRGMPTEREISAGAASRRR